MHSVQISGYLMSTSCLHVAHGADDNITRVMKMNVVDGSSTDDGEAPVRPPHLSQIPFVPSNSIRGRIRRHTLSILTEALMAKGETITRDAYQMLSNGGMLGGADAGALTVGEVIRGRRHVFVGLWGGGPRMLASAVTTCDLVPVCAETIGAGKVPESLKGFAPTRTSYVDSQPTTQKARGRDLVTTRIFRRNDDMIQLNAEAVRRLSTLGPDAEQQIAAYQTEQLGFREDRRAAKSTLGDKDARTLSAEDQESLKKRDLTNFLEMEIVVPGVVWPIDLLLASHVTPAQIALFARGVERFANEQKLGGNSRLGFGQYRAHLDVIVSGECVGTLRLVESTKQHRLEFVDPTYDEALREALAAVSGADINLFAQPARIPSEDKIAARKAAATA